MIKRSVSFVPGGSNSTINLMSSYHFDPTKILQTKEILYNIIPKHWQSYLQRDKFDIIQCSVKDFFDMMQCYQLADNLNPSLKQQNQLKTNKDESKKLTEKPIDKKHKAKPQKNDSDSPALKKACMLHGPDISHMRK
jgi:hypothetical protein